MFSLRLSSTGTLVIVWMHCRRIELSRQVAGKAHAMVVPQAAREQYPWPSSHLIAKTKTGRAATLPH
jgi:hypothetical protein